VGGYDAQAVYCSLKHMQTWFENVRDSIMGSAMSDEAKVFWLGCSLAIGARLIRQAIGWLKRGLE